MTACWNCRQPSDRVHFCPGCGKIQPATPGQDYFSFFGCPRRLGLDRSALEKTFHELSRKFHPDYFQLKPDRERRFSVERASLLNDAYRVLRDPVSRMQYLMEVEGRPAELRSSPPADLLEEVFDLNLQLEEIRSLRQSGRSEGMDAVRAALEQTAARVEAKRCQLEEQQQQIIADWDQLVDQGDDAVERGKLLDRIGEWLSQRSYVGNLLNSIETEVAV